MTMNAALYELPLLQTAGRGRRGKKGAQLIRFASVPVRFTTGWTRTQESVCRPVTSRREGAK